MCGRASFGFASAEKIWPWTAYSVFDEICYEASEEHGDEEAEKCNMVFM